VRTVGDSTGHDVLVAPWRLFSPSLQDVGGCGCGCAPAGAGSGRLGVECAGACGRVRRGYGGESIRPIINALFTILR